MFPVIITEDQYENFTGDLPYHSLIIPFDEVYFCDSCGERIGAWLDCAPARFFGYDTDIEIERPHYEYYYILDDAPSYVCEYCYSGTQVNDAVEDGGIF